MPRGLKRIDTRISERYFEFRPAYPQERVRRCRSAPVDRQFCSERDPARDRLIGCIRVLRAQRSAAREEFTFR